jgi:hypothetical protein
MLNAKYAQPNTRGEIAGAQADGKLIKTAVKESREISEERRSTLSEEESDGPEETESRQRSAKCWAQPPAEKRSSD